MKVEISSWALPNIGSVLSISLARVLHEFHSDMERIDGTSSALMRFISARLSKLLIMILIVQAGSVFTFSLSLSRGQVAFRTHI